MIKQVEKRSGLILPVLFLGDTQVMCYETVELPSLPAPPLRSPQGGMERLLWSLDRISAITLLPEEEELLSIPVVVVIELRDSW